MIITSGRPYKNNYWPEGGGEGIADEIVTLGANVTDAM